MTKQEQKLFNALAVAYIYSNVDLDWPNRIGHQKWKQHLKTLQENNIGDWNPEEKVFDNLGEVNDRYHEMVEEYALGRLPDNYHSTYDYWGAKVITDQPHGTRHQDYVYAGGDMGELASFDDYAALVEYTDEVLQEIENQLV